MVTKKKRKMLWLFMMILAFSMVLITGCKKEETNGDKLVVTIDDSKIYLDEMMYYILQVEAKGESMNETYESLFGSSYWDEEYIDGITYRDMFKSDTIEMVVMYEIFYDKAKEAGYTLSEKNLEENKNNTDTLWESLTEEQKTITELTKEKILKIQDKLALGSLYYDELMKSFAIDQKKLKESIVYDEYRQYDIQYIMIPTATNKEDGSVEYFTKKEKRAAYNKIEGILESVQGGTEFDKIVKEDADLKTGVLSFVQGDETCEEALEKVAITLKSEEVSQIIETNAGYYIVKMVNNNSSESYDKAVDEAIQAARTEEFDKAYEKIKEDYAYKINDEVWDTIVMGDTTITRTKNSDEESKDKEKENVEEG